MVDTHCHLDVCEPPVAELVGRRARRGRHADRDGRHERAVDRGAPSPRRDDHDEVVAIVGRHPHEAEGFDERRPRGDRARRGATRAPGRSARPGSTTTATTRRATTSARAFEAQLELAARVELPVVIHTRAAEDDTFAMLREHAASLPAVILHCFSAPDRLDECVERGYLCSFAGNVTYPKATDLQAAAREVPDELLLVETDSPYLAPQPRARASRTSPPTCATRREFVAELRGVELRGARADRRARTPRACSDGERRAAPGEPAPAARVRRPAPTASSARTS